MTDMLGIPQIAESLRLDTGSVRRLFAKEIDSLNLRLHRGKGGRLLLPKEDAERLIGSYKARRGPVSDYQPRAFVTPRQVDEDVTDDTYGFFYIIQLLPEALPNRVKVGFSDDPEQRLRQHRTAAPTAKLLKAWPCKRSWDFAAMDSITRLDCKLVLNEVYEGDVGAFIERGNAFFALMPDPKTEQDLSKHSPLHESMARVETDGELEVDESGTARAEDADQ